MALHSTPRKLDTEVHLGPHDIVEPDLIVLLHGNPRVQVRSWLGARCHESISPRILPSVRVELEPVWKASLLP
jgi:hypothetical protein